MLISPFKIKQLNISSTWVYNVPTNTDCTICRCNLSTPSIYNQEKGIDSYVVSGDCLHSFHQECIKPWVDKNKSCPICSKNWNYSKKPTDDQILSSTKIDYMKNNIDININLKPKPNFIYNKKNFTDGSEQNFLDSSGQIYKKLGISTDISKYVINSSSMETSIDSSNNVIDSSGYKTVIDSSGYKNIIATSDNINGSKDKIINDGSGNLINTIINDNPKIIKIVKDIKDVKKEINKDDLKYNKINMKDLWKEKKVEQLKYHIKMKYKDSDNKIDDILDDKSINEFIEKNSKDYTKAYILDKTKKINIINKSSETTTDNKKLYVDKMISMFKQKHINIPSPKWDSDSEDNASTDDGKNEEDS
jgi:hypothetical protein